jgi:heat shock protein HtpX
MGEDGFAGLVAANRRRSVAITGALVSPLLVVMVVVSLFTGPRWVALLDLVAVAALFVFVLRWARSPAGVLRSLGALPASSAAHARLHNVVEGLCAAAGLPKPELFIVGDEAPNALAAGGDPRTAVLVVTTGLLEKLDRMELEGVIAHELSHVKSGDIEVSTITANTVGRIAPGLATRLAPRRRELLADLNSVSLTRYPPGLAAALEKLRLDPARPTAGGRAVAHLWIETPESPLEERIAALLEL